jgi:hypothetical protein
VINDMRAMVWLGQESTALREVFGLRRHVRRGYEHADPRPMRLHMMAQSDAIPLVLGLVQLVKPDWLEPLIRNKIIWRPGDPPR